MENYFIKSIILTFNPSSSVTSFNHQKLKTAPVNDFWNVTDPYYLSRKESFLSNFSKGAACQQEA